MKTALLYTRVSSDDQIKGTSLSVQLAEMKKFCAEQGYRIVGHFEDAGESAKTADRPGLIRSLIEAKKIKADAFVVHKLDRLSRNATDGLSIKAALQKHGCSLVSISEPAGVDPAGQFFSTVLFAAAQFDNDIRGARSRSGMVSIAERGGWSFLAPFGFKLVRRSDNLPVLEITHENPHAVAQVLSGYADGVIAYPAATVQLRRLGFDAEKSYAVFKQPVYGGILRSRLTLTDVVAAFPGFVPPETWYRLEQRRAAEAKKPNVRMMDNEGFPLTVLRCPVCGKRLKGSFSKSGTGRKYPYYFCPKHVVVRGEALESCIMTELDKLAGAAALLQDAVKLAAKKILERGKQAEKALDTTEKGVERIREKLASLTDKYVAGEIDQPTFRTLQANYNTEIARMTAATPDPVDDYNSAAALLDNFRKLSDVYRRMSADRKRELVSIMWGSEARIRYKDKKVELDPDYINKESASVWLTDLRMAPPERLVSNLRVVVSVLRCA